MEFDLEKLKESIGKKLGDIRQRYQERLNGAYVLGEQQRVEKGVNAVEQLQALIGEVSSKVGYSQKVMEGVNSLVRRQRGMVTEEGDEEALETLTSKFYAKGNMLTRPIRRLLGGKLSIEQGLDVLHETVSEIPAFVQRLHSEIKTREGDLRQLRTDLREGIESILLSKPELVKDKEELYSVLSKVEAQYNELEAVRKANSEQGKQTDGGVLYKLQQMEGILGGLRDEYTVLDAQERRAEQNIGLLNANIEKIGRYLGMLDETKKVVADTDNFAEVHVPYVMREIEAQRTEIQTLGGVDRVLTFFDRQRELSQGLNVRIAAATKYLDGRVNEVREKCLTASIYPESSARAGEVRIEAPKLLAASVVKAPAEPQEVLVPVEKRE